MVSITVTVDISKRLNDSLWIKYPIITQVGPGRSVPGFSSIGVAASTSYQISLKASSYHILSSGQLRNEICFPSRWIIGECQLHVSSTHAKHNNRVKPYNQPVSHEFILIPGDNEHKYFWFSSLKDHLSWPY